MIAQKALRKNFFERDSAVVAGDLVGKYLVRELNGKIRYGMISEVEAYGGMEDLASHARFGQTKRNSVMWGQAGIFYVYFIYGMYWMLNVVCAGVGMPSGVLIRGVEGYSGPGLLTKGFKIDGTFTGRTASRKEGLWFEDRGIDVAVKSSKRVGVDYAGEWSKKPWNFKLVRKRIFH